MAKSLESVTLTMEMEVSSSSASTLKAEDSASIVTATGATAAAGNVACNAGGIDTAIIHNTLDKDKDKEGAAGAAPSPKNTVFNMRRAESEGGVIDRNELTYNVLPKDIQSLLRKKKYDFSTGLEKASKADVDAAGNGCKPFPEKVKLVDFSNKVYIAPLTTVGNLPFRRILKDFGADITCGEMAMGHNIEQGQASEWALLKRHKQEDTFGVQIAGCQCESMGRVAQLLERHTNTDFIDLNCGCPIDVVTGRGAGSALMNRPKRIVDIVDAMTSRFSRSMTVKIRTGWNDNEPTAHRIVPMLQYYNAVGHAKNSAASAGHEAMNAVRP